MHDFSNEPSSTGHAFGRTLVVTPTYNEAANLPSIVGRVRATCPDCDVLVVDDNSPDGTGQIADELVRLGDGRIHVLHRSAKEGLGAAYVAGFTWGIDQGFAVIVVMDADGSHAPEQLQLLLDAIDNGADVVIGSRYVRGGETRDWPRRRMLLSRTANLYARALLGTRVRDITAGFRAYRAAVLEGFGLETIVSKGYCFQIDLAWRSIQSGLTVVEVPITFVERQHGSSKMDGATMWEAVVQVARWGTRHRLDRASELGRRYLRPKRRHRSVAGVK